MENSKESYFGVGHVPIGIGAQIKGWAIEWGRYIHPYKLPIVDFMAMTHKCPHNCAQCFTGRIVKTLSFEEIARTIDQLAAFDTCGINYVGEGEPTIDKDFFKILDYTSAKGIKSMVFTDAATRLTDREFVRRLKQTGTSVGPKCDSLWNPVYQNWVVESGNPGVPRYIDLTEADKKNFAKDGSFFDKRNEAVRVMMEEGFNEVSPDGTTRMGFDMVVTKANVHEIPKTLRFCRDNNLWIVFSFYIPAGGSGSPDFDNSLALSNAEQRQIIETIRQIDRDEYNFDHEGYRNFITQPCVEFMQIRGNGDISTCPGDVEVLGNVRNNTIAGVKKIIEIRSPFRMPECFDGQCNTRGDINEGATSSIIAEQRRIITTPDTDIMPIRNIEDIETCPVGCTGCKRR